MPDIWLAGGENPAHHTVFTLESVAKVAINVASLLRNHKDSFKGLNLDPAIDVEWLAWTDDETVTLDDLLEVTGLVGYPPAYVFGPEEWDSHPGYLSIWDGLKPMPVEQLAHGLVLTDKAFRVEVQRRRALSGRKTTTVFGVITGKSAELDGFDIVLNTSWYNVSKMGELHVWDAEAKRLWRHNVRDRETKTIEHQVAIRHLGVSVEEVMKGENGALLSLSLRSWLSLSDHLNAQTTRVVPAKPSQIAAIPRFPVMPQMGSGAQLPAIAPQGVRYHIPTLSVSTKDERDTQGKVIGQQVVIKSSSESFRRCDNCNLAQVCPAFTPGSSCNFSIPVEIRTLDQRKALQQAMLEMQTQRIMQSRLQEELLGQGLELMTGKEMTRLFDLINRMNRDDDAGAFKLIMSGKGNAGAAAASPGGILSTLFGPRAGAPDRQRVDTLPEMPVLDVVDAEEVSSSANGSSG